jgi:regulator of sigma E protease
LDSALVVVKGIALTVLAFGLMIFVHELGHFLAAKLIGVRVDRFSFGMGPRLAGRKWGDTDYMISAVPIGGYVKMAGGDEGEEATGAPDEFVSKPPSRRALVLVAGPLFSVLFGIPLAMGMFVLGRETFSSQVSYVALNSPAWDAGVRYGDRITALGSYPVTTFEELRQAVVRCGPNLFLDLVVERGGETHTLSIWHAKRQPLGVFCQFINTPVQVREVDRDAPAAEAGIRPGDVIESLEGKPVRDWADFRRRVLPHPGRPLQIALRRNGHPLTVTATPKAMEQPDPGFTVHLPREVGLVRKGFPADGKLREGDRIVGVNGTAVTHWWEIETAVAEGPANVKLAIERGREKLMVELQRGEGLRLADSLGIAPRPVFIVASIHQQTDPPLTIGDEIIKIGSVDTDEALAKELLYEVPEDILALLAKAGKVTVRRGAETFTVAFEPTVCQVGLLGIRPTWGTITHKKSLFGSVVPAIKETLSMSTFVYVVLKRLVQGGVSPSDLMGPVGIGQHMYLAATSDIPNFLWLVHLITVNIGVFNLIPIPPLDGGRLVMLAYEKVRGKQPSRRVMEAIMIAGIGIVVMIFLFATFNDLTRLFPRLFP